MYTSSAQILAAPSGALLPLRALFLGTVAIVAILLIRTHVAFSYHAFSDQHDSGLRSSISLQEAGKAEEVPSKSEFLASTSHHDTDVAEAEHKRLSSPFEMNPPLRGAQRRGSESSAETSTSDARTPEQASSRQTIPPDVHRHIHALHSKTVEERQVSAHSTEDSERRKSSQTQVLATGDSRSLAMALLEHEQQAARQDPRGTSAEQEPTPADSEASPANGRAKETALSEKLESSALEQSGGQIVTAPDSAPGGTLEPFRFGPAKNLPVARLAEAISNAWSKAPPVPSRNVQTGDKEFGMISYIRWSGGLGVERQEEVIASFTQVQELGVGSGLAAPWSVPVTLFTTLITIKDYVRRLQKDGVTTVDWPFENVIFLSSRITQSIKDVSDLPPCCEKCCKGGKGWPDDKWVEKIASIRHSPYAVTMFLDSDVWVCNADATYASIEPVLSGSVDILSTNDKQNGGGDLTQTQNNPFGLSVSPMFLERNTGVIVYDKRVPAVRELLDKYSLYYLHMVRLNPSIAHDQPAFRLAVYGMTQSGGLRAGDIERNVHCRGTWMYYAGPNTLSELKCNFVHGDNHTRLTRALRIPCMGEDVTPYLSLRGRIARNGLYLIDPSGP
ncbi:hypothetical protein FVE85_2166 [Porphyridium purpureum]|uniref:Nucleotide-diphospho-sugar transferase domain-containing protein n=1 Tax=Porphyridium purpureum TaxID=35688 RepID=A0A5J4YWS4_PORPP|nr:hypothetical protein FVE85_2166 [Porphyridium purpureum]|eukprot:POR7652..scf209_3